ncbi:peptidylprolyl isomerase [Clostridium sp. ZS2-4]|uniref:peptidylprolyl isomerase n=1 Tax=Clostridium sp. ZS2-4 TaxID=2987703 RepID=UPI00227C4D9A|nr:peptidylprolyl isomerase [Clostridium sp. ZS2-4]
MKSEGVIVKNIKKLVAAIAISMFAVSAVGCKMIEKTPEAIAKTTVAKVGDKKITRGELDKNPQMVFVGKQLEQQYGEKYTENPQAKEALKEQKKQILDQMTMEEALMQEAEKLKLIPKEEELKKEVDKKIADYRKEQKLEDDKKYEEMLKNNGLTKESLKDIFGKNIIIEKLHDELMKSVKVEEKDIQDYYNKFKDRYPVKAEDPTKIHIAHILVPISEEKAEEKAKEIKAKLDKGEDFAKLAKEYGTDGTKDKGGDLGTVPVVNSGFDEDFMNGAMQLKNGEISAPVKTQFGYHIIKMIKREEKPVKPLTQIKDQIKNDLLEKKKNDLWSDKLKEIKDKAKIKIYEEELV